MGLVTLLWCSLIHVLAMCCHCQTYDDRRQLLDYLFSATRYNKAVPPVLNQSMPINVHLTFRIIKLADINIATKDTCARAMLRMSWTDEMLTWNASDYGGISGIVPPSEHYWKPDIYKSRHPSACKDRSLDSMLEKITIKNDGTVDMILFRYWGSFCSVNVRFFPFDQHRCVFRFYDSSHDPSELLLETKNSPSSNFISFEHAEWKLDNIDIWTGTFPQEEASSSLLRYSFYLYRRPEFIVIHHLIPASFICLLNTFVPLIPPDSGERLSYAVTTYLASVFMTLSFYKDIPNDSMCITLLSYDLVLYYAISSFTLIWSIAMICMSRWSTMHTHIPVFLCRCLKKYRRPTTEPNPETPTVENTDCANDHTDQNEESLDITTSAWYDVSRNLDKLYFVMQLICYVIVIGWNVHFINSESWSTCATF